MIKVVGLRLLAALGVILALTVVVFFLQYVLPADPARALSGARATPEQVEAKREELGLDKSIVEQYRIFITGMAQGDLGDSLASGQPITEDLFTYAPATIELSMVAFFLALIMGLGVGAWSVTRSKSASVARVLVLVLASLPVYFVAMILIIVGSLNLGILPSDGQIDPAYEYIDGPTRFLLLDTLIDANPAAFGSALSHLIIPAFAIALGPAMAIARSLRSTLGVVMNEPYVTAARAKGLRDRVIIYRHGMRNAIGPVLSVAGLQLGGMLAGVLVIESIVGWPGLGEYTVHALNLLDFPAVMGTVLFGGVAYVLINMIVDFLQLAADPRMRAAAKRGEKVRFNRDISPMTEEIRV